MPLCSEIASKRLASETVEVDDLATMLQQSMSLRGSKRPRLSGANDPQPPLVRYGVKRSATEGAETLAEYFAKIVRLENSNGDRGSLVLPNRRYLRAAAPDWKAQAKAGVRKKKRQFSEEVEQEIRKKRRDEESGGILKRKKGTSEIGMEKREEKEDKWKDMSFRSGTINVDAARVKYCLEKYPQFRCWLMSEKARPVLHDLALGTTAGCVYTCNIPLAVIQPLVRDTPEPINKFPRKLPLWNQGRCTLRLDATAVRSVLKAAGVIEMEPTVARTLSTSDTERECEDEEEEEAEGTEEEKSGLPRTLAMDLDP